MNLGSSVQACKTKVPYLQACVSSFSCFLQKKCRYFSHTRLIFNITSQNENFVQHAFKMRILLVMSLLLVIKKLTTEQLLSHH